MIGLLRSEGIKFSSTQSAYWMLGIGLLLSGVFAYLMVMFPGPDVPEGMPQAEGTAAIWEVLPGAELFGVLLIWILGIVSVAGEYRFGTIRPTFLAEPTRWKALAAKGVFFVVVAAAAVSVFVLASLVVAELFGDYEAASALGSDGFAVLWRVVVYTCLGMLLALGLGYLMRNAAGAIVLLLIWMLVVETFVPMIPRFGEDLAEWMPFQNGTYWMRDGVMGSPHIEWGAGTALVLYAAVAVVIFAAGVVTTLRRDA